MKASKMVKTFLVFLGIVVSVQAIGITNNTGKMLAGTARMNITPPLGIEMSGYPNRYEPARSIHDSLYAKFLVLESQGVRVGIISCDLAVYNNKAVLDASKKLKLDHLLISSIHTHSGPVLSSSKEYEAFVEKSMIAGLSKALKSMSPAGISAGYGTLPQLGYNRITGKGDDIALWRNFERIPYGPVDPQVGVIRIDDEKGSPRVILLMYACHPVANLQNLEISADFCGVATSKVEEAFGKNTMCMYLQGAAGDINPLFMSAIVDEKGVHVSTDFTQIETMGGLLAGKTIEIVRNMLPESDGKESIKVKSDSLKFTGRFNKKALFNVHITTILINEKIAIAASPGEYFVKHQLFWKENADVPFPYFIGYIQNNGGKGPGYVADMRSAAYGGYGADASDGLIEAGAGETIMLRHLQNLFRLRGIMK
jgi:neutral ceramidase